jgi:hypothetical protein
VRWEVGVQHEFLDNVRYTIEENIDTQLKVVVKVVDANGYSHDGQRGQWY